MGYQEFLTEWRSDGETVWVHTSGSTGQPKAMQVEKCRMVASAEMTCDFLGLKAGDRALLCLSTDYIAGKMMVVRSQVRDLILTRVEPSNHPLALDRLPADTPPFDLVAMVPSQVYCSLQVPEERERLQQTRHLLIGGGAVDDALASELADFPHHVWSTYGMTETLSHIALRRLNGPERSQWYTSFDGVSVSLSADGCLVIDAPAIHDGLLVTRDLAELSSDGRFRILGRKDNVVCSGGIKIQMEELEHLLQPFLPVPYMITWAPHAQLGQQVVLLMVGGDVAEVAGICRQVLPRYWQPRHVLQVDTLPMTATGKPARKQAEKIAAGLIHLG